MIHCMNNTLGEASVMRPAHSPQSPWLRICHRVCRAKSGRRALASIHSFTHTRDEEQFKKYAARAVSATWRLFTSRPRAIFHFSHASARVQQAAGSRARLVINYFCRNNNTENGINSYRPSLSTRTTPSLGS